MLINNDIKVVKQPLQEKFSQYLSKVNIHNINIELKDLYKRLKEIPLIYYK